MCTKQYPKAFSSDRTIEENGNVRYQRRDDGRMITINGNQIDNQWVAAYNRDFYVKYDAQVNVESCAQKNVIKYLHRYMRKGPDRATFILNKNNQPNGERGQH